MRTLLGVASLKQYPPRLNRLTTPRLGQPNLIVWMVEVNRWDEKAGLRRDAVRSQVIDALKAQEIKETGNEKG
jgi:hypothetical protein